MRDGTDETLEKAAEIDQPPIAGRQTGTILRLTAKGFGFLRGEDGRDYFLHHSDLTGRHFDTLTEGESVSFVGMKTAKGLRATEATATPLEEI